MGRCKIKLENVPMLLGRLWHAKRESVWQRPEMYLINIFSPLYFFRPLLMCFRINGNFGKNKANPAQIAKETVRIKKETRKIKADFANKAKNRIIKCKTDVSSTLRESSVRFRNGKVFKRRSYEVLRNCEFYKSRMGVWSCICYCRLIKLCKMLVSMPIIRCYRWKINRVHRFQNKKNGFFFAVCKNSATFAPHLKIP